MSSLLINNQDTTGYSTNQLTNSAYLRIKNYNEHNNEEIFSSYSERIISKYSDNLDHKLIPSLSEDIKQKIEKANNNQLSNREYVTLLKDIAKVSIEFYSPKIGQYLAIQLTDGQIVATDMNEFDLLIQIQGKKFSSQLFIWKVGTESFSGWTNCQK